MTPTLRHMPARRLLAVAAALALAGGQAEAKNSPHRKVSLDGDIPACPLGSFHCPPRPDNYAMCRPNALLDFYDPTMSKDASVRDTSNTLVWAESVDSSDQTVYHLSGKVRLQRADQLLQADTTDYNNDTTDYDARGNVRYQEAGQLVAAERVSGNTEASRGIAKDNVRYQMLTSRGNGIATQGEMLDADHSRYTQATYSTCDVGHHVWEVRGKSIFIDKDTGRGVARGATMRVGNVPLLYMPYFSFPVDNRRQSGFLMPIIGNTSRAGFRVTTPYYLNLAPNYDATLEPSIYTSRGLMLGGEFRYLFPGGYAGQLNFEYVPRDNGSKNGTVTETKGDERYLVKFVSSSHLWDSWSLGTNINRASDRNYLYDYGNDLYNTSIGTLTSSAYANGGGTWWNASIGGDIYQNVNPFYPDSVEPYKRLPRATLNLNIPLTHWLEFGMNNEAVAFHKSQSVNGKRVDLSPYLAAYFQGASWFVRPKLAYRYTAYQLDAGYQRFGYYTGVLASAPFTPFNERSPSRALPIASVDSGLIFDRTTSLFGSNYTQTLEPRLYYLYVPYRNQNNLPLFDTNVMSFDYWQLFSPNQYSGADRQMNANNLTGAITTRLLDDSGVERLSASFGQIRYLSQQKVQLPYGGSNVVPAATDWSGSDYVAQLNMQLNDQWRLGTQYQWSPNSRRTDLGVLELQRRLSNNGILNFSYRYRRDLLEQYSASAVYPISDRWRLLGSWTWSAKDRTTIEALAGVEYDSCCVALRVVNRNYVNLGYSGFGQRPPGSIPKRNNAVMFEVEFKGLGSSSTQIEPMLRRDILGYQ
ncbi:LPS-assembly protein LptD [Dyella tabacisoli]|uniref:LPS-assembly protein LptD n=1 Tax=Dyella tabacisoli TaxID=2282381 RepID=A0A369URB9_9GAMM|nr:LPS assembly protein LptD [Dyella tabacisoli]RDD82843.1 LPS-assembly protein LptD [Dyella tabacisoli]